jgi:hypothetical protein
LISIRRGVFAVLAGAIAVISMAALASLTTATPAAAWHDKGRAAKPHVQSFSSTLQFGKADFDSRPGRIVVYGNVESANKKCLANRTVKLLFSDDGGVSYKFRDTSTTSSNGDWIGDAPATAATVKVVLVKSKFGSRKHPKSCEADTLMLD